MSSSTTDSHYVAKPEVIPQPVTDNKKDTTYPSLFDIVGKESTHVPPAKLPPLDNVSKPPANDNWLGSLDKHPLGTKPSSSEIGNGKEHQDTTPPPYSKTATANTPKSGKKKYVIFACVLLAIIIIIGCILAAVFLKGKAGPNTDKYRTTTTTSSHITNTFTTEKPGTTPRTSSGGKYGQWSNWYAWRSCSASCGASTQSRIRTCHKAEAELNCIGLTSETRTCNTGLCPGDTYGQWSNWYAWRSCSATCGDSTQSRIRTCHKDISELNCIGVTSEARTCNMGQCPDATNSQWSSWSAWDRCAATCGDSEQTRQRNCENGGDDATCVGDSFEKRTCNIAPCKGGTNGQWSDWNEWNMCAATCGESEQTRMRMCDKDADELNCVGNSSETRTCNIGSCPESSWSAWESWGNCDVTCGSGKHFRNRQCLSTNCIGVDAQQQSCYVGACPRLVDLYGTWTTWFSWSSCGATCGDSTQSRNRICNKDANDLDCLGDSTQTRPCSAGLCQDCSKQCPVGTVLSGCTICSCSGTSGSGLVLTESGSPLDLAKVTPLNFDYEVLDITDATGSYTVVDYCIGDELKFEKEGYLTETMTFANPMPIVRLANIVRLDITKHPLSASRIVGGCVDLSCSANGFPAPSYYEWFKNGILLEHKGTSMRLSNLQSSDAGQYRCRASNDYGSAYSNPASIQVEDTPNGFCDDVPASNIVDLPDGCHINGQTSVDKGQCSAYQCSLGLEINCITPKKPTCHVIRYDRQEMQCEGFVLPIFIAKQCGCVEQDSVPLEFIGTVLSKSNNRPLFQANIMRDGKLVATTNWGGRFTLEIESSVNRLTLLVRDTRGDFLDESLTLHAPPGSVSKFSKVVYMRSKPDPIVLSSTEMNKVSFKERNNETISYSLEIPSNAYYTADGTLYTGTVNAFVSTIDTSNPDSVLEAPGDFTAMSQEGEEQMLESYGMFRIDLEDLLGNRLTLGKNVSFELEVPGWMQERNEMKFWFQDESSRWVYVSDLMAVSNENRRRKRQSGFDSFNDYETTIAGDIISGYWCNVDQIVEQEKICYSRVKAYKSNKYNVNQLSDYAQVTAITFHQDGVATASYAIAYTDYYSYTYPPSGYCIAHPCNTPDDNSDYVYRGYIIAKSYDFNTWDIQNMKPSPIAVGFNTDLDYLATEEGKAYVNFNLELSNNGPFYDSDDWVGDSEQCSNAPIEHAHFRFYEQEDLACPVTSYTTVDEPFSGPAPLYWYPSTFFAPNEYRACYVKVTTSITEKVVINSKSEVGTYTDNIGDILGTRAECTEKGVACMEIRTPGRIYTDWPNLLGATEAEDSTRVYIYPHDDSLQYINSVTVDISDQWISDIQINQLEVSFLINGEVNEGTGSKVFCYSSLDKDDAKRYARNKCVLGQNDADPTDGNIVHDFWGIRYD